jgi:hypothetical protein
MDHLTLTTQRAPGGGRGSRARLATAALSVVVLALVAPPGAGAAQLTLNGTCFAARQRLVISGTAFTPSAPVSIAGDVTGAAQADAAGRFTTEITAPAVTELGPRAVTVTVVDRVNPANTAPTARSRAARASSRRGGSPASSPAGRSTRTSFSASARAAITASASRAATAARSPSGRRGSPASARSSPGAGRSSSTSA